MRCQYIKHYLEPPHMLSLLRRYFTLLLPFLWNSRRNRLATLATGLLTAVDTLAATAAPWLFSEIVKAYDMPEKSAMLPLIIGVTTCWLLTKATGRLRNVVFFQVVNQAIRDIRFRLITHLHQTTEGAKYSPTEMLSASTRVSICTRGVMRVSIVNIFPAMLKLGSLSLALYATKACTGYFLAGVVVTFAPIAWGIRIFLRSRQHLWDTSDNVLVAMREGLHQAEVNKLQQTKTEERLGRLFDDEAQRWWRNNLHEHMVYAVQAVLYFGLVGVLLVYLVGQLKQGGMTLAMFVLIKGYVFSIYQQLFGITHYVRSLLGYMLDFRKILDILALPLDKRTPTVWAGHQQQDAGLAPTFQVKQAAFRHTNQEQALLKDISLTIQKGEKVAITGASGNGKTTLCHLLAGLYLPTSGEVCFEGTATQQLPPTTIGKKLHFVAQEAALFAGSIQENLLTKVAPAADSPLGYLSQQAQRTVGEGGKKLSSGEKQRILLARCLEDAPSAVILDEALSCLDEPSAQALLDQIFERVPTVVLVTHRKSLLKKFSRIYTLEQGHLMAV